MKNVLKRSKLNIFLFMLIMLAIIAVPLPAYAGGILRDTSWYNTSDSTFTLTTRAQLYGLADIVNGAVTGVSEDFKGKTIKLGADISLNENVDDYSSWDFESDALPWTPIGNANSFGGTFDGQGHTISGLFVAIPESEEFLSSAFFGTIGKDAVVTNLVFSKVRLYAETFAQAKNIAPVFSTNLGTVSGVRVKDLSASSSSNVAGFGVANEGTVKNCRVYNFSTDAHSIVAGLINLNKEGATVDSCGVEVMNVSASGVVFADNYCAGLVFFNRGSLKNSYINRAAFSHDSSFSYRLSTLANENSGAIENCYAQGEGSSGTLLSAIYKGTGTVRNVYSSAPDVNPNIKRFFVVEGTRYFELGTGQMLSYSLNSGRNAAQGDRNWTWDKLGLPVPAYLIQLVDSAEVFGPKWATFGEPITMLTPSRTNYDFAGWYLDAALTHKWDPANDFFIDDSIMYGKWTKTNVEATLTPATLNFDAYDPKDATATLDNGTQTFLGLKSGDTTLTQGSDYSLAGTLLTLKSGFLKTLDTGDHSIAVRYSTCSDLSLTVKVGDSAPKRTVTEKSTTGGTVQASTTSAQRGEEITLTSKPDDGYEFIGFKVDGERIVGSSFTMPDKDVEVSAEYRLIDVDPTLKPITLDFDMYHPKDATATLDHGTQTFTGIRSGETTLTQGSDYTLEGKELTIKSAFMKKLSAGDNALAVCYESGSDISLTIRVSDSALQRAVIIKSTVGGTVQASATSAKRGEKITLTSKTKDGYEFISYVLDGERISGDSFIMPDNNVEVGAVYKLKAFTIAAPVSSTKAGRVVGTRTVTYGGTLRLSAYSRAGYYFVRWTKDGKAVTTNKTLVVKGVTSQATYKAVFAKLPVNFKLKRVSGNRITVRWNAVKGASSYQIMSKRAVGSTYRVRWTGKNSTRLYTSIDKRTGKTYLYKMRYSKMVKGKRVWSAWTPALAIK